MNRFRLDGDARTDLLSIHAYIARDNLSAADRLLHEFKQKFRLLALNPLLGQERPELAPKLRSFCVGNFVVYYRPAEQGIEVVRVLHAARDVDAQFY